MLYNIYLNENKYVMNNNYDMITYILPYLTRSSLLGNFAFDGYVKCAVATPYKFA